MRSRLAILVAALSLVLAACGQTAGPGATGGGNPTSAEPGASAAAVASPATTASTASARPTATLGPVRMLRIALFVNGSVNDESFFESANNGVQRAKNELGADITVVQEPVAANWEGSLRRLAQSERYDLIVLGTFQLPDALNAIAPDFPEQKFIFFDATADQPNVASITYAQNEGSFLAGALAGCVATSDLPNLSGDKKVGVVGGEKVAVIDDFIVGYEQGAKYVDPEIEVIPSYVGTGAQAYNDPAKAKELAAAQFEQGAAIVFQVAGGSGLGVIDAAKEQQRFAIGVDSDQNGIAPGVVLASMLKRVDNSVYDLIRMEATGSLQTGKVYRYGIENEGVSLRLAEQNVPEACVEQVRKAEADIASRKVRVETAFE